MFRPILEKLNMITPILKKKTQDPKHFVSEPIRGRSL